MIFNIKARNETMVTFARKIGYRPMGVDAENEFSIARTLIPGKKYPRFHIYMKKNQETDEFEISLHLDQKMPSYEGTSAHSGEYEGALIDKEETRIRKLLTE